MRGLLYLLRMLLGDVLNDNTDGCESDDEGTSHGNIERMGMEAELEGDDTGGNVGESAGNSVEGDGNVGEGAANVEEVDRDVNYRDYRGSSFMDESDVFRAPHDSDDDSVVNLSYSDVTKKVQFSSINLSTSIDCKE
ncbi:hypothetical protein FH972_013290 [Carpinus fangiana]|uniref:Uncharacterized protein n=1 Tax=Carpinus fangiana TaxID=176857 RepID=A0A5N6R6B3_9ROSI|nr:hypothetical protein FH972_013290 [Carpinus fangiana]